MAERNYSIGNFTEEVKFLRPDINITETGSRENKYVFCVMRLCEMQDSTDKQEMQSDALAAVQSYSLVTWKVIGLTTEWRVEYNGERYYIDRILNESRDISRIEIRKIDLCNS